jgi:hypothetical protein
MTCGKHDSHKGEVYENKFRKEKQMFSKKQPQTTLKKISIFYNSFRITKRNSRQYTSGISSYLYKDLTFRDIFKDLQRW